MSQKLILILGPHIGQEGVGCRKNNWKIDWKIGSGFQLKLIYLFLSTLGVSTLELFYVGVVLRSGTFYFGFNLRSVLRRPVFYVQSATYRRSTLHRAILKQAP